jgi:6-phosphogluconolactonase
MQKHQLYCFTTPQHLAEAATVAILEHAQHAIAQRGRFTLVLAGGSTPRLIYQLLSQAQADWQYWWIFWGDERCLPIDDTERNSLMAQRVWLEKVAIPTAHIFPIPAEKGAQQGAAEYQTLIGNFLPFDCVLLGMGEDGHTASLFPEHTHPIDEQVHAVYQAPKPPADRVSLSASVLSQAEHVLFLINGTGKQDAFKQWQQGTALPVAQIVSKTEISIYIDAAALGTF